MTRADKNCIVTPTIQSLNLSTNRLNNKGTNIKANKSTGADGIALKLIRLAGEAIIAPLTDPYLHSMKISTVYNNRKTDRLKPVSKNDYETDRSKLRPLSILRMPSKIMKSCVNDTVGEHVDVENQLQCSHRQAMDIPYGPFYWTFTCSLDRSQEKSSGLWFTCSWRVCGR